MHKETNAYLERVDFSKIKSVFAMPDLLDIQVASYNEYLQMDLLPEERKEIGLQAAFKDVFPISDFKETTELEFLSYSIGNWECKCGRLKGVENSRAKCNACGTLLPAEDRADREGDLPVLRGRPEDRDPPLRPLRGPGRPQDEVHGHRVHPEGLHLLGAAEAPGAARLVGEGPRRQDQAPQTHQAAGGLLRRHPADDGKGHVHLQRHRAGRRQPAPAVAGRVLPAGRDQGLFHRQAHPVPGRLGRVRVRRQEQPVGPPGPQEEVPGHGLPAGPGLRDRRGHPEALPQDGQGRPRGGEALSGRSPTASSAGRRPRTSSIPSRRRSWSRPGRRSRRRPSRP